jgi:hypothetical protein
LLSERARNAGLRGQTIVVVNWKQHRDQDLTGKCFHFVADKNKEKGFVPAMAGAARFPRRPDAIFDADRGPRRRHAMGSEKGMRTRLSHFLRDLERDGLIGAGTTLHGLRVSYVRFSGGISVGI